MLVSRGLLKNSKAKYAALHYFPEKCDKVNEEQLQYWLPALLQFNYPYYQCIVNYCLVLALQYTVVRHLNMMQWQWSSVGESVWGAHIETSDWI